MEVEYITEDQRIAESQDSLEQVKRIIENNGYNSKEEAQNQLDLAEKELAYSKGEISFKEYWKAHLKIYKRKEEVQMENKVVSTTQNNELMSILDSVEVSQVAKTLGKISQFQSIVQQTLKNGHDYGEVGGVTKPTLLKPGAEKILMLMGLTSEYNIIEKIEDYDKGIFAYTIKCILLKNNRKVTEGVGSCNSKEDKYRWRWVKENDLPIGIDKSTTKSKVDNWGKTKYKIENDDICSQANTILKMAKKRAQIDATLTVASLSEIFTQDVEDMSQFQEREAIETMKAEEVVNIKINFGKHKGETLGQIMKNSPDYIEWLAKNGKDPALRKACSMLLESKQGMQKQNVASANEQNDSAPLPDYEGTPFEEI